MNFRRLALVSITALTLAGCGGSGGSSNSPAPGGTAPPPPPPPPPAADFQLVNGTCPSGTAAVAVSMVTRAETIGVCEISAGTLTGELRLTGDDVYRLTGSLQVGEDRLADPSGLTGSLVIEPGAIILMPDQAQILVHADSTIDADGLATDPIIITAAADLDDLTGNSAQEIRDAVGDGSVQSSANGNNLWGSLLILGRAPAAGCDPNAASPCETSFNSERYNAGGDQADKGTSTLRNVRLQYLGDGSPALWFGRAGRGNFVENVHVHTASNTGLYLDGGTTNFRQVAVTDVDGSSLSNALWAWSGYQGEIDRFVGEILGDFSTALRVGFFDRGPRRTDLTLANATFFVGPLPPMTGTVQAAPYLAEEDSVGSVVNSLFVGFEDDPFTFAPSTFDARGTALADYSEIAGGGDPTAFSRATNEPAPVMVGGAFAVSRDHIGAFDPTVTTYADSWLSPWALEAAFQ